MLKYYFQKFVPFLGLKNLICYISLRKNIYEFNFYNLFTKNLKNTIIKIMKYYNGSILTDLKIFFLFPAVLIGIFIVANFFSYTKTMECDGFSCTIYRIENSTKQKTQIGYFNQIEFDHFGIERESFDRQRRVVTYPVVYLKDGRKITLNMINLDYNKKNYDDFLKSGFNYLRNKKF